MLAIYPILFFVLVFGFRKDVGVDFSSYAGYFDSQQIHSVKDVPYEAGFYYIIGTLKSFGFSSQSLFVLTSIIQAVLLTKIVKAYNKAGILIFIFYFLSLNILVSLNILRQSLSLLFCILAVIRFNERRYLYGAICLLMAPIFHLTSIVFGALLVVLSFTRLYNFKYLVLLLNIASIIYCDYLSELIKSFMSELTVDGYYSSYLNNTSRANA